MRNPSSMTGSIKSLMKEPYYGESGYVEFDTETSATSARQKGKRLADVVISSKPCSSRQARRDSFEHCVVAAIERYLKRFDARIKKGRAKITTSEFKDPYSIEEAMDVLNKMENVSRLSYYKAVKQVVQFRWRKIFIDMSVRRRQEYLEALEL